VRVSWRRARFAATCAFRGGARVSRRRARFVAACAFRGGARVSRRRARFAAACAFRSGVRVSLRRAHRREHHRIEKLAIMTNVTAETRRLERRIVFLVGAVQLVNVLDFTMVMPLGPDFARALGIPMSQLGKAVAGYGQAAALAGFTGSFVLDRFDRKRALAVAMVGLVAGTLLGGLARDLWSLTLARVVAGLFGGPATSLAYAIIADTIPQERRGKAMGAVMGAFSVAQVLGVPSALLLSERAGWAMPFFVVAGMGLLVALGAITLLPPLTTHLAQPAQPRPQGSLRQLLSRSTVLISLAMTATLMTAGFILVPNLPAYVQQNLHYPRDHFQYLIAVGGAASFVTLRLAGRLVDRFGSTAVGTAAVLASVAIMYVFLVAPPDPAPVMLLYVLFMVTLGARNVAYNALTTKVPRPYERARFLSIQSTVYHAAAGTASWFAASLLSVRSDGQLVGVGRAALIAMGLSLLLPLFLWQVESRVKTTSES
jgi:predicted MFS family arabinose efflux permease